MNNTSELGSLERGTLRRWSRGTKWSNSSEYFGSLRERETREIGHIRVDVIDTAYTLRSVAIIVDAQNSSPVVDRSLANC